VLVEDVASQIAVNEKGDGTVAEITPDQAPAEIATAESIVADTEPQPAAINDSATQVSAAQEDDTSAAKRAIIHEWENWSALHSDELSDAKVAEYFFEHLQKRKSYLLAFAPKNDDGFKAVQRWIESPKVV
jgi:hypothetical protein